MTEKLSTWAGGSTFEYEGSVTEGTRILYGIKPYSVTVSTDQYRALLNHFRDSEADMGTSRDSAPGDAWVHGYSGMSPRALLHPTLDRFCFTRVTLKGFRVSRRRFGL
jgi:hypothetical protein